MIRPSFWFRLSLATAGLFVLGAESQCPLFAGGAQCSVDADCDEDEACNDDGECESEDNNGNSNDGNSVASIIGDLCEARVEENCVEDESSCEDSFQEGVDAIKDAGAACDAAEVLLGNAYRCWADEDPCSEEVPSNCQNEADDFLAEIEPETPCGIALNPSTEGEGEGENVCADFIGAGDGCDCGCGVHDPDCDEVGGGCTAEGCCMDPPQNGCQYCN